MMNLEKQNKLRSLSTDGLRFQKEKRNRLDALPKVVSSGELFLFPVDVAVKWCATFTHSKDDDLWYIVPGDEFSEVGTRDVALADSCNEAPLVFRCGNGIWVHVDDFDFDHRIGAIDQQFVEQIRDHLGRIVKNDLPTVDSLVETDDDPDYVEWMEELSSAVQEFEQVLLDDESETALPEISPASMFGQSVYSELADVMPSFSLVAETKSDYFLPRDLKSRDGLRVQFDGPWFLIAVKEEAGIVLQLFHVEAGSELPEIMFGAQANEAVRWHEEDYGFAGSLIPWSDDAVQLTLNRKSIVLQRI